jgi:hypothetical protein
MTSSPWHRKGCPGSGIWKRISQIICAIEVKGHMGADRKLSPPTSLDSRCTHRVRRRLQFLQLYRSLPSSFNMDRCLLELNRPFPPFFSASSSCVKAQGHCGSSHRLPEKLTVKLGVSCESGFSVLECASSGVSQRLHSAH